MRYVRPFAAAVLCAVVCSAPLGAQERRQGGPTPYDVAKEQTFQARVVSTETFAMDGREPLLYLTVTIESKNVNVFLAPESWMKQRSIAFTPGAAIQIKGVAGYRLNGDAIMPRTITAGGKTLSLRDETGKPLWPQGSSAR